MRFVVFIDLLGTLMLPATVVYLIWLIVTAALKISPFPLISIIMIAAVYGLQIVIFLLKRQWQYIGWMVIYLLAYPVWSFFLPVYSFWHMDDFSWGTTRIVVGEKGRKKIVAGTDDEPYDDSMIPMKKFSEYQHQIWDKGSVRSGLTSVSGSPFANPGLKTSASTPGSLYKAPLGPYTGGSAAGSEYGGDYFQNTNVLEQHSRQNSGPGSAVSGFQPAQSRMSMGFAPSMYGMPMQGSMYALPAGPMPSMYSGFPSMYGMPGMAGTSPSLMNMATPAMPSPSAANIASPVSRPQSVLNPFAPAPVSLPPSDKSDPTDTDVIQAVQQYLAAQPSLMSVTKRSAREAIIAHFPNAPSVAERKALINKAIDDTLRGDL